MWIESSFDVKGRRVGVSVKRLEAGDADRLAAQLAWCVRTVDLGGELSAWDDALQAILGNYVEMTVDPSMLDDLDTISSAICAGAFDAFIRINRLDASIKACFYRETGCSYGAH